MPMEHHLEHEIRLSEEGEYKSLYSWALQEFTKDGKSLGSSVIPWQWRLYFHATETRYSKEIELKHDPDEPDAEDQKSAGELIYAQLRPAPRGRGGKAATFSMLGTDRLIKDFSLSIRRLKDGETGQQCRMWGIVSYTTDFDFEDQTTPDCVGVEVALSAHNFDELRGLVENGRANDELTLCLKGVAGFYSEWSPSIRTSDVKVLAEYPTDQPVVAPDDCTIEPPRLGDIQEFGLTFNRRSVIAVPQAAEPDQMEAGEDFDEDIPLKPALTPEQQQHAAMLQVLIRVQESLNQSRVALWFIAALVAAVLLFK